MVSPKMSYLYKLLRFYTSKGGEEFINSKIRNAANSKSLFFCCKCCRSFIPKVNATARFDGESLMIECVKCKKKYFYSSNNSQG